MSNTPESVLTAIDTIENYLEEIGHPMKGVVIQHLDELYSELEVDEGEPDHEDDGDALASAGFGTDEDYSHGEML